ncbi:MAG TPA: hypothetical protein VF545_03575 [Thermoleophilaceae bacterium]
MPGRRVRAAALVTAGAFAVHQVRYLLTYGPDSDHRLASEGHAYLTPLLVLLAFALALGAAVFVARVARGRHGRGPRPDPPLARTWAGASLCLFVLYALQESLEALLDGGHPVGLAGILGGGGWAAIPLSLAIGLLVALALRGADAALEVALRPAAGPRRARPPILSVARADRGRPSLNVAARHLAGRGPPAAWL